MLSFMFYFEFPFLFIEKHWFVLTENLWQILMSLVYRPLDDVFITVWRMRSSRPSWWLGRVLAKVRGDCVNAVPTATLGAAGIGIQNTIHALVHGGHKRGETCTWRQGRSNCCCSCSTVWARWWSSLATATSKECKICPSLHNLEKI